MNEEHIYISKQEYENLKSHSLMLGRIASLVEDFCEEEETTELGVRKILSELYFHRSENVLR